MTWSDTFRTAGEAVRDDTVTVPQPPGNTS